MPPILTHAEHEVARLWAAGLSCAAIAARRGTSRSTSTALLARAKRALCADDRREVAARIVAGVQIESHQAHGRPARTSRFGFQPGQRVRMTGGLYAGREGFSRAAHSAVQIKVAIGAGVVAVGARFVEAA
jgi:DNA-binding CsgD family transcriptional regulator